MLDGKHTIECKMRCSEKGIHFINKVALMLKQMILKACFVCIFVVGMFFMSFRFSYAEQPIVTNIVVNNTFNIGTELEIKCDYNYRTNTYAYFKRIIIPKKTNRTLTVPGGRKQCEIWVIRIFLFGGKV